LLPQNDNANIALKYVKKQNEVAKLIQHLETSEMPVEKKATIVNLLEAGGARTA
jgi:hypothetical protein